MKTFTDWCAEKGFVIETSQKAGEKLTHDEKIPSGVRDIRKDLSKDYKGNFKHNGTVDPFKVVKVKGKAEQAAK